MISKKTQIAMLSAVLLIIIAAGYLWRAVLLSRGDQPQKIVIGSIPARISGLLYIAQEQGYLKARGLEVTVISNASSPESIMDLKSGRIDLACCGAFNLVKEGLAGGSNLRCLTVLCNGQIMDLIARQDKGISRPEDLRGKTVGLLRGTAAEFFLGRFLTFNHISFQEVTLVDVKPSELAAALTAGKVDALVVWEPYTIEILKKLGPAVVTWPSQERQDIYWLLVGKENYLKGNSAALEKLLAALEQAAKFIQERPREARGIICQRTKFPGDEWDRYPLRFELFLDHGLLLHLEDQAAWMIQNRVTDQTKIPDFLDYLAPGPLLKVNPKAVRLVLPGHLAPK